MPGQDKGTFIMICYKDRWWCNRWEKCENGEGCDRALTHQVLADAQEWWNNFNCTGDAPLSICSPETCFEEK